MALSSSSSCGRNAGYPAPPARTRTCSFPASGSSVVLAFASSNIARMLVPHSEVGSCCSSPTCPARVSFGGYVLPSGPSPGSKLSPPPSTLPEKTPQGRVVASHPPGSWFSNRVLGSSVDLFPSFLMRASVAVYPNRVVPTALDSRLTPFPGFPVSASIAVYPFRVVPTAGAPWGFPSSLTLLFLPATA